MLLWFLRWLRANSEIDIRVLVVNEGELLSSFAEVGEVTTMIRRGLHARERLVRRIGWASDSINPPADDVPRLERALRLPVRRMVLQSLRREVAAAGPVDLLYLNSVSSAPALRLVPSHMSVLTHAHELGYQLSQLAPSELSLVRARTDRYVAAAHCVREALVEKLGVEPSDIDVCHEFIPVDDVPPDPAAVEATRERLDLAPDTLVVGSVGVLAWIKGPDLLIHVARLVLNAIGRKQKVAFVWMGSAGLPSSMDELVYDVDAAGLGDRIRFIDARRDARPVMAIFDLLVLPSRSDPFPLVCLEAAALGKPIVCFDSGGMREFLEPDERLIVPYLDLDGMAARIVELLGSESEREAIGRSLARRVRERHRLEVGGPHLLGHIERMLDRSARHYR
jgi:glycosyltransferase involved in cell wall biosynthesis